MPYDETLWNDYAKVYDEVLNVIPYQNLLLELVEIAFIEPGMRIFDGCCGTGNLLWALTQQDVDCDYTGVDLSRSMLEKAKTKLKKFKGTAKLVRTNLDDPSEKWGIVGLFDRLIFNNCLAFLSDPADIIRKAGEIAAPSAKLIMSTPSPDPNISEILEEHLRLSDSWMTREEALERMMPQLQPIMKCNELLMQQYGDSYHLPREPQLRGWFKDSGWTIDEIGTTYSGQNWLVVASKKASA